ncbi:MULTISPECIES: hypothetical protein [unclassified Oceanobacillus]|uniref:hypothetical protein n=1 Tax=unclassified Oceanobacillus TaxID=2630292 RepID=UPI00300E4476
MKKYKAILNIYMADKLIKAGFSVIEVKPSSQIRGRAAFIFEDTAEFRKAFRELSYKK